MELYEKKISSERIYEGKFINMRKDKVLLENGRTSYREVVEHPGAVCILPIDKDGNIIFVRQFRYPFEKTFLELPAGKIDKGEKPEVCGRRELKEETGYTCEGYEYIGKICTSVAFSTEQIYIYLASKLTFEGQKLDDDEFLKIEKIPFDKAMEMALNNEIEDSKTICGLLKVYALKLQGKLEGIIK